MHVEYSPDDYSQLRKQEYRILVSDEANYSCQSCRKDDYLVFYVQIGDGRWQPPSNVLQSEAKKTAPAHPWNWRSVILPTGKAKVWLVYDDMNNHLISARPQRQTNANECRILGDLDQLESKDTVQKR